MAEDHKRDSRTVNWGERGESRDAPISIEALLDEHDLARVTKRSVSSVRRDRLLKKGCPWVKINSSVRYRYSDLQSWLASLRTPQCER